MSIDFAHLNALELRLSHYRDRLRASGPQRDRAYWQMLVDQAEREVKGELRFLGLPDRAPVPDFSDDELLSLLGVE